MRELVGEPEELYNSRVYEQRNRSLSNSPTRIGVAPNSELTDRDCNMAMRTLSYYLVE